MNKKKRSIKKYVKGIWFAILGKQVYNPSADTSGSGVTSTGEGVQASCAV